MHGDGNKDNEWMGRDSIGIKQPLAFKVINRMVAPAQHIRREWDCICPALEKRNASARDWNARNDCSSLASVCRNWL